MADELTPEMGGRVATLQIVIKLRPVTSSKTELLLTFFCVQSKATWLLCENVLVICQLELGIRKLV
jgi:hypothetical protein